MYPTWECVQNVSVDYFASAFYNQTFFFSVAPAIVRKVEQQNER